MGNSGGRTAQGLRHLEDKVFRMGSQSRSSPKTTPFSRTPPTPGSWEKSPRSLLLLSKPWFSHLCSGMREVLGFEDQWAEVCDRQWWQWLVFMLFESVPRKGGLEGDLLPCRLSPQEPSLCFPHLQCLHLLGRGEKTGDRGVLDEHSLSFPPPTHFLVTGF